jgi:hypothetical protein
MSLLKFRKPKSPATERAKRRRVEARLERRMTPALKRYGTRWPGGLLSGVASIGEGFAAIGEGFATIGGAPARWPKPLTNAEARAADAAALRADWEALGADLEQATSQVSDEVSDELAQGWHRG